MGYTDGYEKIPGWGGDSASDNAPYAAYGTEVTNEDKGPGPSWAKRPQKSDPHTGTSKGT